MFLFHDGDLKSEFEGPKRACYANGPLFFICLFTGQLESAHLEACEVGDTFQANQMFRHTTVSFLIVQKRHNTRIFMVRNNGNFRLSKFEWSCTVKWLSQFPSGLIMKLVFVFIFGFVVVQTCWACFSDVSCLCVCVFRLFSDFFGV